MSSFAARNRSKVAFGGALSRLIRATAASAPSMTDNHAMGRRGALRQVDDVRHLTGFLERFDDAHGLCRDCLLGLISRSADVMRAINARFVRNRIREFCDCGSRLDREHVETGP